jgi:hypothetical protein
MISKMSAAAAGWQVQAVSNGSIRLLVTDGGGVKVADTATTGALAGEWHCGIAVVDRSTGKMRVGTKGFTSGTSVISAETTISGNITTTETFRFGQSDQANSANFLLAGAYVGTGSGAATGLSANLSTALNNLWNAVASSFSVSLSTSDGRVTISNGVIPSSISFTNTTLRDLLGFATNFDYPATASEMATAVGYGTWSAGYLCNETTGNLTSAFGTPATLTAVNVPTYSNAAARGGADKAVGFDSSNDAFSGGDMLDVQSTYDLVVAWVGRWPTALARDMFSKYAGAAGWGIYSPTTTSVRLLLSDGTHTFSIDAAALPANEFYVGIAAVDRSTNTARIGIQGLTSGTATLSTNTSVSTLTDASNAANLLVGCNSSITNNGIGHEVSAWYIGSGVGAAAGIPANLTSALSNWATYMRSQTSTKQARGLWFPDCPLSLEGDPDQAPKVTDARSTMSPSRSVITLVGNSGYQHKGVLWSHVPKNRTWESAVTYSNASWEYFSNECLLGLGSSWFTPGSEIQIYYDSAGTQKAVGNTYNSGAGIAGWQTVNLNSIEPRKSDGTWDGLWRIELGDIESDG